MERSLKERDAVYNLNDFDVVKEFLVRKDEQLFDEYCAEMSTKLTDYQR